MVLFYQTKKATMKKFLKAMLVFAVITAFVPRAFAQPVEWHKITDPAVLTTMTKIDPYLGHPGTKTTRNAKDVSLTMLSNKDSSLNITLVTKEGTGKSEVKVMLKKTKGKWYSDKPYSSNKTYVDGLVQKITGLF